MFWGWKGCALRKAVNCPAKGHLLACKRWPFAGRFTAFCQTAGCQRFGRAYGKSRPNTSFGRLSRFVLTVFTVRSGGYSSPFLLLAV